MIQLFSVKNGKYHVPADPAMVGATIWRPTKTACGVMVTPVNYFENAEGVNSYTGGRLERYLCQHCKSHLAQLKSELPGSPASDRAHAPRDQRDS